MKSTPTATSKQEREPYALPISVAGRWLGVSPRTVRRLLDDNKLVTVVYREDTMVQTASVKALMERATIS